MSDRENIHVQIPPGKSRVAWVTLDRPPLNVLDLPMIQALDNALRAVIVQSDLLVFQGAGPKGFSAGVEVRDHTPERVRETLGAFHGIFRQLWQAECLTVAAVHGYCLGGGCELASFCDFVIATESAQFGQPEIKLGCFPPVALVTLPSLVGARAAADLILTGRTISAREAHEMGLVTRVVADDALASAVDALLSELGALSPAVLRISRQALRQRIGMNFEDGLRQVEHIYLDQLIKTEDASEGIYAFLEKRQPVWRGC